MIHFYWDAQTEDLKIQWERAWQGKLKFSQGGGLGRGVPRSLFGLRIDVKKRSPHFDVFVCGAVLIFMQQIGRKERSFLVKQKANLRLKQFSLRLFQLLGKMSWKISCMYNSHTPSCTHTHTNVYRYAKIGVDRYRQAQEGGTAFFRTLSFKIVQKSCTQNIYMLLDSDVTQPTQSHWELICVSHWLISRSMTDMSVYSWTVLKKMEPHLTRRFCPPDSLTAVRMVPPCGWDSALTVNMDGLTKVFSFNELLCYIKNLLSVRILCQIINHPN